MPSAPAVPWAAGTRARNPPFVANDRYVRNSMSRRAALSTRRRSSPPAFLAADGIASSKAAASAGESASCVAW